MAAVERDAVELEKGGDMAFRDVIAQLHQDITTAEDAGDEATAARLRAELAEAKEAARRGDQDDAEQ
ncbi:hypothetical protein AB0M45_05335 [Nocardia sp. NPDC051787]|uniref:hypothetical protein n=1 Tax=Nocardia sp. NPDC051787 TaxID=3155415 RepID=UPI003428F732